MSKKQGEFNSPELDMINSTQKEPFKIYGTNAATSVDGATGKLEEFIMKDIFWIWAHSKHGTRAGFSTSEEALENIREFLRSGKK